jgi:hypothetical protein
LVWVLIVFGLATGGFWYHRYGKMHNMPRIIGGAGSIVLSDNTLAVLTNLNSAVEIRFYSLLDPATVPAASLTFAERVDRLLAEFQQVAGWKLSVTRYNSLSDADAASADGIKPFNIEKGPACFLGITVICGEQKESLPQLQPEWEPALEYDLARAILRVTTPPATVAIKAPAPVSPEITNEVLRLIPDITGTALEDGIGILRAAAVTRFVGASAEMEKQIQAAQQQVANAQNGQSDAEKQAAVKHLQQVQLEQAEKVKAIAAELQAQIATFEQMKTAAPATK